MEGRYIFISYSRRDSKLIKPISKLLRTGSSYIFRDEDSIKSGSNWRVALLESLQLSDTVLVFWSKNSRKSPHVKSEYMDAIKRDLKVIPILIDNTPLSDALSNYQYIDFRGITYKKINIIENITEKLYKGIFFSIFLLMMFLFISTGSILLIIVGIFFLLGLTLSIKLVDNDSHLLFSMVSEDSAGTVLELVNITIPTEVKLVYENYEFNLSHNPEYNSNEQDTDQGDDYDF